MQHIEKIIIDLKLNDKENDLVKSNFGDIFSKKTYESLNVEFNLYAVFLLNRKPFILFFDNPHKKCDKELHKWIWNNNQSPVAFIVKKKNIDILNGFSINKDSGFLNILDSPDNRNNFNYLKLVTGETWEIYQDKLKATNRVDYHLLQNIQDVRERVIAKLIKQSKIISLSKEKDEKKKDKELRKISAPIANALTGRFIFIRYLIDRKVKLHFENNILLTKENLIDILQSQNRTYILFEYLKKKFNGDLFPFISIKINNGSEKELSEKEIVTSDYLKNYKELFEGTEIKSGQTSLFPLYDFSILPIEFISNVYEQFIGADNQKKQGAYYTPLFLVDYMLEETVSNYFTEENNKENYSCKILDPACGSGIYLVESLRKIIEQYQKLNPDYYKNQNSFKKALRNIVRNNIFGIDKDKNAIDIAIFSIYITLLDYQKPADIETFSFPPLKGRNLIVGDFFNTELINKSTFRDKSHNIINSFDIIIGNTPWGKVEDSQPFIDEYIKNREDRETEALREKAGDKKVKVEIKISHKQIPQAFLIRVSDFAKPFSKISLLITSKILYNLRADEFRNYFLENFYLDKVFEISSVRRFVFDKAKTSDSSIAPASVLFYRYASGENTHNNIVNHISLKPNLYFKLFKLFVIEKYDIKEVLQKQLIDNDWLFKLLVYGNVLDYELIKKLKQNQKIEDVISDKNKYIIKTGIKYTDGEKSFDSSWLIGKDYIKSDRDLKPFIVLTKDKWVKDTVGYLPAEKELFTPPILFVRKRIDKSLVAISAIEKSKEKVFTCSITGIKAYDNNEIKVLENISAHLNSDLLSYFLLQTNTSAGIERGDIYLGEILKTPFNYSAETSRNYKKIEKNRVSFFNKEFNDFEKQQLQKVLDSELIPSLNETISDSFNLDHQERALVNYASEISIPVFHAKSFKEKPFKKLDISKNADDKKFLDEYAQVYLDFFRPRYTNNFGIEIYHSDYAIAFRFYHTDENITEPIKRIKQEPDNIFSRFLKFSYNQITDKLFIQKDIRDIEEDAFYILKPNQYKLWHNAIAYLDAYEFNEELNKLKVKYEDG